MSNYGLGATRTVRNPFASGYFCSVQRVQAGCPTPHHFRCRVQSPPRTSKRCCHPSEGGTRAFGAPRAPLAWGQRGRPESRDLCIFHHEALTSDAVTSLNECINELVIPSAGDPSRGIHAFFPFSAGGAERSEDLRKLVRAQCCHPERGRDPRVWGPTHAFCVGSARETRVEGSMHFFVTLL
jgi:hypothetical protein